MNPRNISRNGSTGWFTFIAVLIIIFGSSIILNSEDDTAGLAYAQDTSKPVSSWVYIAGLLVITVVVATIAHHRKHKSTVQPRTEPARSVLHQESVDPKIAEWLRIARLRGYNEEHVKEYLVSQGYPKDMIEKTVDELHDWRAQQESNYMHST